MSLNRRQSRRDFLRQLASSTSVIALPALIPGAVLGRGGTLPANERVHVGIIGTGGRGSHLAYNRVLQERMEGYQGWAQWWDYSGGDVTLHGAHAADQIQYTLGKDHTGPVEIWPAGKGRDPEVTMKYADGTTIRFERAEGVLWGAVFIGDGGKIELNRGRVTANPAELVAKAPASSGGNAEPHLQNWLDCIKTREKPIADVEAGHRAVNLCHLINICRELGRKIRWDSGQEQFVNDPAANALLDRPRRRGFELPAV